MGPKSFKFSFPSSTQPPVPSTQIIQIQFSQQHPTPCTQYPNHSTSVLPAAPIYLYPVPKSFNFSFPSSTQPPEPSTQIIQLQFPKQHPSTCTQCPNHSTSVSPAATIHMYPVP